MVYRLTPARKNFFASALKVSARSSCGKRAAFRKTLISARGFVLVNLCACETGDVRASWPQAMRDLCGTRGQRSESPRLSLPETNAAGKYLAPG